MVGPLVVMHEKKTSPPSARCTTTKRPPAPPPPMIIYDRPPPVIHVEPNQFKAVVQKLTGCPKLSEDYSVDEAEKPETNFNAVAAAGATDHHHRYNFNFGADDDSCSSSVASTLTTATSESFVNIHDENSLWPPLLPSGWPSTTNSLLIDEIYPLELTQIVYNHHQHQQQLQQFSGYNDQMIMQDGVDDYCFIKKGRELNQ